jgi:hypothetical protein
MQKKKNRSKEFEKLHKHHFVLVYFLINLILV